MTKTCWKCKGEIPDVCKQCQWCGALFESEWSSRPPAYIARQEIQWDPDNPRLISAIEDEDKRYRQRQAEIQAAVDRVNNPPHRLSKWADRHWRLIVYATSICLSFGILKLGGLIRADPLIIPY